MRGSQTGPREHPPAAEFGPPRALDWWIVMACAVPSLLLSPLTAVWAAMIGPVLLVAGAAALGVRPGTAAATVTSVGLGLLLGVAPYFLLALVQAGSG